ncbi:hypothetical protein C7M84_018310 [Penaeus vannamei]|uniref:Uncharacterized protein n=1 Tax=Penaeus vannamei TaxID=6689 RepID=A0A423SHR2_PENVA|nr:hypothetical protein C7M84_018310 [Penaeus vannamei]
MVVADVGVGSVRLKLGLEPPTHPTHIASPSENRTKRAKFPPTAGTPHPAQPAQPATLGPAHPPTPTAPSPPSATSKQISRVICGKWHYARISDNTFAVIDSSSLGPAISLKPLEITVKTGMITLCIIWNLRHSRPSTWCTKGIFAPRPCAPRSRLAKAPTEVLRPRSTATGSSSGQHSRPLPQPPPSAPAGLRSLRRCLGGSPTRLPAEAGRGKARRAAGGPDASPAELLYLRTPHHVCLLTASAQQHPFSFLLVERAPPPLPGRPPPRSPPAPRPLLPSLCRRPPPSPCALQPAPSALAATSPQRAPPTPLPPPLIASRRPPLPPSTPGPSSPRPLLLPSLVPTGPLSPPAHVPLVTRRPPIRYQKREHDYHARDTLSAHRTERDLASGGRRETPAVTATESFPSRPRRRARQGRPCAGAVWPKRSSVGPSGIYAHTISIATCPPTLPRPPHLPKTAD